MGAESLGQGKKLLDQLREVMRRRHYSIRTEQAYRDWVRRYVKFHRMQSRADLAGGTGKVEAFLTYLAVEGNVAPSTQNQALNCVCGPGSVGGSAFGPAKEASLGSRHD